MEGLGGRYRLTPCKARLAMAVVGQNRHYHLYSIHRWHWVSMGAALGLRGISVLINDLMQSAPAVLEDVGPCLPPKFPPALFEAIARECWMPQSGWLSNPMVARMEVFPRAERPPGHGRFKPPRR